MSVDDADGCLMVVIRMAFIAPFVLAALDTLFPVLAITYTVWTFLAMLVLCLSVRGVLRGIGSHDRKKD